MKCKSCSTVMKPVIKHKSSVSESKEFTLFHCQCGTILKEGRDAHLGTMWIMANGAIVTDRSCNISINDPEADRSDFGTEGWKFKGEPLAVLV